MAEVAELADALGSGPSGLTMPVEVQVLSSAPSKVDLRKKLNHKAAYGPPFLLPTPTRSVTTDLQLRATMWRCVAIYNPTARPARQGGKFGVSPKTCEGPVYRLL